MTVRFVRFALKVAMQNDRDFVDVISLCVSCYDGFPFKIARSSSDVQLLLCVV